MVENINILLHLGQGRSPAMFSHNQVLNYLGKDNQEDQTLLKFRAITDHHGPLDTDDPNYKRSLHNVMVEWETGEITEEPFSIIVADDQVTCAGYAMKHSLLNLTGWWRFRNIARNQKSLTRAVDQTENRQVRWFATYHFSYLIP